MDIRIIMGRRSCLLDSMAVTHIFVIYPCFFTPSWNPTFEGCLLGKPCQPDNLVRVISEVPLQYISVIKVTCETYKIQQCGV